MKTKKHFFVMYKNFNNGEIEKRIFPNDLDEFLNNGWNKGRLKSRTEKWRSKGTEKNTNKISYFIL